MNKDDMRIKLSEALKPKLITVKIKSIESGRIMEFSFENRDNMERHLKFLKPNHFEIIEIDEDQQTLTF